MDQESVVHVEIQTQAFQPDLLYHVRLEGVTQLNQVQAEVRSIREPRGVEVLVAIRVAILTVENHLHVRIRVLRSPGVGQDRRQTGSQETRLRRVQEVLEYTKKLLKESGQEYNPASNYNIDFN